MTTADPNETSASGAKPWWSSSFDAPEEDNPHDVGTITQEAVKLAAAVVGWAEKTGIADTLRTVAEQSTDVIWSAAASYQADKAEKAMEHLAQAKLDPDAHDDQGEHSSSCEYCPICQGMDLFKNVSPEARQGLLEAMSSISDKLRQAVDGFPGTPSSARVEHINID